MTQTWTVSGMTCDHCVASVTEEVAELPGVRRVDVVLANGALVGRRRATALRRRRARGGRGGRLPAWSDMTAPATDPGLLDVDLDIEGMTCASCAHRIERKLNKLDGVDASVSFASERAHVRYPAALATEDLIDGRTPSRVRRRAPRPHARGDADTTAGAAARRGRAVGAGRPLGHGARDPVRRVGVVVARSCRAWWSGGRAGSSTGRPRSTRGTARAPWTPWSPSARWPPGSGRRSRWCAARATSTSSRPPWSRRSCWPAATPRGGASSGPATRCGP